MVLGLGVLEYIFIAHQAVFTKINYNMINFFRSIIIIIIE